MKKKRIKLSITICMLLAGIIIFVCINPLSKGREVYGDTLLKEFYGRQRNLTLKPRQLEKAKKMSGMYKEKQAALKEKEQKLIAEKNRAENQKKPPEKAAKPPEPVKKIVYLTFDDGPSANITPKVLDLLKVEGVKATFFVIGTNVEKNPDILKRIIDEGHAIGNHTYSHDATAMYASLDDFKMEMDKWEETMKGILGPEFSVKAFRFPGGNFGKHKVEAQYVTQKGYKIYDWNAISQDAEPGERTSQQLFENVKNTMKDKPVVIVLNHDSEARQNTLDSMKQEIEYIKSKGYTFETLKN
ncbi:MAG: polysaccharide deacetylase family protein [Bacillota bacterium]|nr:polysaccharide deacetylase family protein [Bacillota bacterium]